MDFTHWLRSVLWPLKELFPVEIALTLGLVFFALSWVLPRKIVNFPALTSRTRTLVWLGTGGAFAVVAIATVTSWISQRQGYLGAVGFDGWWRRPAPLLATAIAMAVGAIALSRAPQPAPGERAIAPRHRWWHFAPRGLLGLAATGAALLFLTASWHTLIGVSAPSHVEKWDQPGTLNLPIYFEAFGGAGYLPGAGWPNHLATLLALGATSLVLILALGRDANRPAARASAASVRAERTATARVFVLLALGGILLTLGAVWAHIGFVGEGSIGLHVGDAPGAEPVYVGTSYQAFARFMHLGGYVIQGLGAALLLRLGVDTLRAAAVRRRNAHALDGHAHTLGADAHTLGAAALDGHSLDARADADAFETDADAHADSDAPDAHADAHADVAEGGPRQTPRRTGLAR